MKNRHFEHYICYHVFDRIKVWLYDGQGDEIYSLDMPREVFEKMLEIMTDFKNGTYKPSDEYKENTNA